MKKKIESLIKYICLSYIVAIITIILIFFSRFNSFDGKDFLNCINIMFSTNACFIITTEWGMKSVIDVKPNDTIKVFSWIGVLICASFNVASLGMMALPDALYWVMLVLTILICIYVAYKYIVNETKVEEIIEKHNTDVQEEKALQLLKSKNKTSFEYDNEIYRF